MTNKKTLQNWFYVKKSQMRKLQVKILFKSFNDFYLWYQLENMKGCYYCGLKQEEQLELIKSGLLKSKRFFNQKGQRGRRLEVDRKNPDGDYSNDNCVLCCYFCNNDKSDIFNDEQYLKFSLHGKHRVEYLRNLIKETSTKI